MYVTFFRSSSFNTWDFCNFKFYLGFNLGMREPSGFKAVKGNMVHKALELLGRRKLAEQNGETNVVEEETGTSLLTHQCTPDRVMQIGFDHYAKIETHHTFTRRDYVDCRKWLQNALDFRRGLYNPLKRHVLVPEQYFEFAIEEPWAEYHYELPDGTKLHGHLGLKGTVDLVTRHPLGYVEYLDWKTGQRKDWATGKVKDFFKLCVDSQLRMYHYALSRLYPDAEEIFVTIFYVQFLEPFSICFTKEDLLKTEQMLRKRFELIRATTRPRRIWGDWKCSKLCHFGKTKHPESSRTMCEHINDELLSLGMDKVNAKYMKAGAVTTYGSGGGRSDVTGPDK